MYYQSFYGPVRPFDPPVLGPGRERGEIPLDLSLKAVGGRQDGTDADDLMLLEQRKLAQLAGTLSARGASSLLDPTLFRLPYGASPHPGLLHTMTSPFCPPPVSSTATFAAHPAAMMSSLLQQQRDTSAATQSAAAMSSFLDPSAALSLHLRPTVTTTSAGSTRGLFAPAGTLGLPSYPALYPDIFTEAARRRETEKGAFTAIRNAEADSAAARYVDHLQRLSREQHLQAKCTSACCVPTLAGLSQTTQAPCGCCIPTSATLCATRNPMTPCGLAAAKDGHKMCNGPCNLFTQSLSLLTPRPTPNDVRIPVNPYSCPPLSAADASRREAEAVASSASLFTPSNLWSGGLPTLPVAPTPAQPHKPRKEGANVNQKESPRAARDFPGPPLFDKNRCHTPPDRKESAFKSTVPTVASRIEPRSTSSHASKKSESSQSHNSDVVVVEDSPVINKPVPSSYPVVVSSSASVLDSKKSHHHSHHYSTTNHHSHHHRLHHNHVDSSSSSSHHNHLEESLTRTHPLVPTKQASKAHNSHRDESGAPPTKMPRLEAVKPTESVAAPRSTSPQEPPPLIAAVASSASITSHVPDAAAMISQFPGLTLPYHIPPPPPRMMDPSGADVPPISATSTSHLPTYHHHGLVPSSIPSHERPSEFAPPVVAPLMMPVKMLLSPKVNGYGSSPGQEAARASPHPFTPVNRIPDGMALSSHAATHHFETSSPAQGATAPHPQPLPHQETSHQQMAPVATPAEEVSRGCDREADNVLKKLLTRAGQQPTSPHVSPSDDSLTNKRLSPASGDAAVEECAPQRRTSPPPLLENKSSSSSSSSRKRSMLECLASSEGYVAEKVRPKTTDLFADPSQLGREERALQRAMLQFEDLGNNGGSGVVAPHGRCISPLVNRGPAHATPPPQENQCSAVSSISQAEDAFRLPVKFSNQASSTACLSKTTFSAASDVPAADHPPHHSGMTATSGSSRREVSVSRFTGFRAKRKLRKRLLAKLYKDRRSSAGSDKNVQRASGHSLRQSAVSSDRPGSTATGSTSAASRLSLRWRQRRLMQAARRRRFRSGMDMINQRRRKNARSAAIRLQRRHEARHLRIDPRDADEMTARLSNGDDKQGEDNATKNSTSESSNGPVVPQEIKRLMVNKALGETILHRAARLGYPDVVLYCLETKACGVNARDNAGYTPLHECCSRGHLEIARALLQYGADVNASAAGGIRPLHDAVENDHVELVRLLLAYGADPTIATYSGLTPLKLARSPIMVELLRGFLADITGETDGHPVLPWKFAGSASCLDPEESGYDVFDTVPSDREGDTEESDDFLFEVSDAPLLPTFRLQLPDSKSLCNCLRLSDVLKQCGLSRESFCALHSHVEVFTIPRHEFESSATCSQLLTGSKLDTLLARDDHSPLDNGHTIDVVKLDDHIRDILGIETITLR